MSKYRVSDFCHFIDVSSEYVAAFNSLTLGVLFIDTETARLLNGATGKILKLPQGMSHELVEAMIERRLIFPLGEREDLNDYLRLQNLLKDNGIAILYLLATDGCNLGCAYCYIENALPDDYNFSLMSKDTADKALNLFVDSISKTVDEPKVVIYGGEPLMNMDVVRYVIDRFQQIKADGKVPEKTGLIINTNATLIDENFLTFIQDKEVQIAVSLDGSKEMHDEMRKYKDGRGTHDKVIENCKLMLQYGVDFGFSVTITKANIYYLEEILIMIHEEFGMSSIGFNIAINQSEKVIGMTETEYAELVTEKLIHCFEICRIKGIYEDRIMRKVNAFVAGYPYIYDCGAPGDQLVVLPDGMVGVCQAYCGNKKNFVPMENVGKPADHQIWSEWRYRSPLYLNQCYGCISLAICGGGCPYNAELKTGSIWGIDEAFCIHSKNTVEFLIKDLFKQTQI